MNEAALGHSGFSPEKLKIQVGKLVRQEWDLDKAKLDYDLNTLKVYKQRCSDAEALHYHAAREHSYRRHTAAVTAAKKYLDSLITYNDTTISALEFQASLSKVVKQVAFANKITESDVLTICVADYFRNITIENWQLRVADCDMLATLC